MGNFIILYDREFIQHLTGRQKQIKILSGLLIVDRKKKAGTKIMPKKLAISKVMKKNASDFRQDEWTDCFCQEFRELRNVRIIPTNRIFAKEIGLDETGLSHVLRGCRNFPQDYRLSTEKVLSKYQADKRYLERTTCQGQKFEYVTDGLNALQLEILTLEKRKAQMQKEIDKMKDEVVKLQTILIERLEYINDLNNS